MRALAFDARHVAVVSALAAGCGRWNFDEARSGSEPDAPLDAEAPACDPGEPFGVPVPVAELNDLATDDGTLRLAPDGRAGYMWSRRTGRGLIYYVTRPDVATPFTMEAVTGLSASGNDLDPAVPLGGTTILVFRHNAPGDDLWMATAVSATAFSGPAAISNLNSAQPDAQASFGPGDEMIFQSARTGNADLYRTMRTGAMTFAAPTRITELSTPDDEGDPTLSSDGLTLYFRSTAPAGALLGYNIYVTTRADLSATWAAPTLVPNVNSALDDGPSSISLDGCQLFISSDRNGTNDIFVATRGN